MKNLSLTVVLLLISTLSYAIGFSGTWSGKIDVGAVNLTLSFDITNTENGEYACTMSCQEQGLKKLPTQISIINEDSIVIDIVLLNASFAGRKDGSEIKGTFTQNGFKLPLILQPGEVQLNRPQTPQPPFPYETSEVSFENKTAEITLCGTLTYPVSYVPSMASEIPVVLFVSGSGLQNRDEEIFGHKPFAVLADHLARHGIASLRYNDRSVGCSTGDATYATTQDFKSDAAAALDYLRSLNAFGHIGVVGHSEGGLIAFMLAAEDSVDFIVTLAAPSVRGDTILIEQNRAMLSSLLPEQQCNDYCSLLADIFNVMRSNTIISNPEASVASLISNGGYDIPDQLESNAVKILYTRNAWIEYFIYYDPSQMIRSVYCPVFSLNGALDTQVKSSLCLEAIKQHLPNNRYNKIKEYPLLNHLFQHCITGSVSEYGSITETISEEVLDDISNWIKSTIMTSN